MVYHKILNIVPCAIQQDLVVCPFLSHLFVFHDLEETSFDYLFDL